MKDSWVGVLTAAMVAVIVALACLRLGVVEARGNSQSPAGQREKTAGESFKNIQVFNDLPESQLNQAMFFMKAALGVECTHCHVDYVNFEKDDKPTKQVARDMIRMVRTLNKDDFDGRNVVSCNTCHRGQSRPSAPLAFAPIVGPQPAPKRADTPPDVEKPTVDQIFVRYVEATGGTAAQTQLATLVMTGSKTTSEGWTAPLEICEKAPGKSLSTFELRGSWRSGFDGAIGWGQDNQGVHALEGEDLASFRLKSSFFRPSTLKGLYAGLVFAGTETVAGHAAYVVEGTLTGAGPQKLFFDVQSGLLVRIAASAATPFGPIPEEFDVEDYRSVGNIRLPFTVSDLKPDFSSVDRVDKISTNVPISDARFERPAAQDVYRNIQVLSDKRASDVLPLMDEFNHALGVACTFCHVADQWQLEDKPQLATAGGMFRMVTAIGDGLLKERGGLTCWTCHRGQSKPSRFPSAELDASLLARWPAELSSASDNVKLTMTVYARSLGVTCEFCHVTSDWKSLAKPPMATMPTMLKLFDEFPKYSPAAANRSQCWMCHQGSTSPERRAKTATR
jgi:hypothetical protein